MNLIDKAKALASQLAGQTKQVLKPVVSQVKSAYQNYTTPQTTSKTLTLIPPKQNISVAPVEAMYQAANKFKNTISQGLNTVARQPITNIIPFTQPVGTALKAANVNIPNVGDTARAIYQNSGVNSVIQGSKLNSDYIQKKIGRDEFIKRSYDYNSPLVMALSFPKTTTPSTAVNYTPFTLKDGKIVKPSYFEQIQQILRPSSRPAESAAQVRGRMIQNTINAEKDPFLRGLLSDFGQPPGSKTVFTDKSAQYSANIKGGGFTGKVDPKVQTAFKNWINARSASKIEGIAKRPEFSSLDNKGIEGLLDFQSGTKKSAYGNVKTYFDTKYKTLQDEGIKFGFKRDYLPQIWSNSEKEVEQVFGKRLGTKPSFTIDSVIKDYKEGIAKGLKPKFTKISDLVVWYEQKANKAIADKQFFNYLGDESLIQPSHKAPQDWITIDPDRFPKIKIHVAGESDYVGTYKAPAPVADMINNYLKQPESNLDTIANMVSSIKNRVFSAGVPFTGWNFHGLNVLTRNTLAPKNPITGFLKGAYYLTNPKAPEEYMMKNLDKAAFATKHGLKLGVEDFVFKAADNDIGISKLGKLEKGRMQWFEKMFSDPLFQKAIPAMKIQHFNEIYDDLIKSFPREDAARKAAEITNNIYGGINTEQIARSRDFQNILRSVLFAPDWLESNARLGAGITKSLLNPRSPEGKAYRTFARNLTLALVSANVINKITSGHYMHDNEPGHTFEIEIGQSSDGKSRYLRPFGTAVDFLRIPLDVALGLAKGDPTPTFRAIRNRLSTPLGTAVGLMTNTDYRGRAIYGTDKYGNELGAIKSAGGIASQIAQNIVPTQVSSFIDYVTGRSSSEEALSQGLELPLRYSGSGYPKTINEIQAKKRQLYDAYAEGNTKEVEKLLAKYKLEISTTDALHMEERRKETLLNYTFDGKVKEANRLSEMLNTAVTQEEVLKAAKKRIIKEYKKGNTMMVEKLLKEYPVSIYKTDLD